MAKRLKTLTTTLSLLLLTAIASPVQAEIADVQASYWVMQIGGTANVGDDLGLGTEVDLEDDLGYTDDEGVVGLEVTIGSLLEFGFAWMGISQSASEVIDTNISFKDLEFKSSNTVTSEIEANLAKGFLRLNLNPEIAKIGLELGVAYADFTASAAATEVGSASADAQVAWPYIGAVAEIHPIEPLSLNAGIRFASWDYDDRFEASYVEFEIGAKLHLGPAFVGAAYRNLTLDALDKKEFIDLSLDFSGPVLFAGLSF